MSKIIPFKDMRVEKPDTYKITRSDGIEEIVKIEFAPGMIYEQGTKDNAENFNSIQNNCVYRVDGVRKIEGNEEIYDIVITDYSNYTPSDLTILINIDSSNTTGAPKIRLNKEKYSIINEFGNVPINFLTSKNTFTIILDYIKKTAKITSGDYKLKPATATAIGGVKSVVNDLVTTSADRPLSSDMGKALNEGKWKVKNNFSAYSVDADTIFENGEFCLTSSSQSNPPIPSIGSNFFLSCRMTLENQNGYGVQVAYGYGIFPICYRHYSASTKTWDKWSIVATTFETSKNTPQIGECRFFDDPNINPATIWSSTTWSRIASGRNIRGSNAGDSAGSTGGSDTVIISQPNLPNINLLAQDHTHTIPNHAHTVGRGSTTYSGSGGSQVPLTDGNFGGTYTTSSGGGGETSKASTRNVPLGGSNTPLDVTNAFYKLHIWKRLS